MPVLRICTYREGGGLRPEGFARCACGSFDVMAIQPGSEDERGPGGILVARGAAAVAWCVACHPLTKPMERAANG